MRVYRKKENPDEARRCRRIKTELAIIDFLVANPNSTSIAIRKKLGLKKDHTCILLRELEQAEVVKRGKYRSKEGFTWRLT